MRRASIPKLIETDNRTIPHKLYRLDHELRVNIRSPPSLHYQQPKIPKHETTLVKIVHIIYKKSLEISWVPHCDNADRRTSAQHTRITEPACPVVYIE